MLQSSFADFDDGVRVCKTINGAVVQNALLNFSGKLIVLFSFDSVGNKVANFPFRAFRQIQVSKKIHVVKVRKKTLSKNFESVLFGVFTADWTARSTV